MQHLLDNIVLTVADLRGKFVGVSNLGTSCDGRDRLRRQWGVENGMPVSM